MGQPFPCCSCCRECTALFAENWALRFCGKVGFVATAPTPEDNADNQAYMAAINAAFNNVSLSWSDTSFVESGTTYTAKVCQVSHALPYTVHLSDEFGVWHTHTVADTRLTVAAAWDSAGVSPQRCRPGWGVMLTATFDSGPVVVVCVSPGPTSGGTVIPNGDGFYIPPRADYPSGTKCRDPYALSVGEYWDVYAANQVQCGGSVFRSNIFGALTIPIRHSTGAVSLPACDP